MTALMLYSLVLSAVLTVFWGAYRLLRIGNGLPGFSRGTLLALIALAFIVAAIPFAIPEKMPEVITMEVEPQPMIIIEPTTEVMTTTENNMTAIESENEPIDWIAILTKIYVGGLIVSLCLLTWRLWRVLSIVRRSRKLDKHIRLHDDAEMIPFTWGKWVIMSQQDYGNNGALFLAHERAHLHGAHWLDLLAVNLAACLTWYCPVAVWLRRELVESHEFAADRAVLSEGFDAQNYQLLLIHKATGRRFANSVAPCINHKSLKKRILMMQNPLPAVSARKRALALIPVVVLAIAGGTALGALRPAPAPIVQFIQQPAEQHLALMVEQRTELPAPAAEQPAPQKEEKVYSNIEKMPQFVGGETAMYTWISHNLRYPEEAALNNVQGRVVVQFVVKTDGTIGDVKVVRGTCPALDDEAVRVVKAMPKWIPGEKDGKPVNATYTLPLTFKLRGESTEDCHVTVDGMDMMEYIKTHSEKEIWIGGKKATAEEIAALKRDDIKSVNFDGNRIEINKPSLSLADYMRQNPAIEVYLDDKKVTPEELEAAVAAKTYHTIKVVDPSNPEGATEIKIN